MTIQQIIETVAKVGRVPVTFITSAKHRPAQTPYQCSLRACVARLARELVPTASYPAIAKSLGKSAHSTVIAMVDGDPSEHEVAVMDEARRQLWRPSVASVEPPSEPEHNGLSRRAGAIIGILNADPDTRREVIGYLRSALEQHAAQRDADRSNFNRREWVEGQR